MTGDRSRDDRRRCRPLEDADGQAARATCAAAARWAASARPACRSSARRTSRTRPGASRPGLRPERPRRRVGPDPGGRERHAAGDRARRSSATPPTSSSTASRAGRASTSPKLHDILLMVALHLRALRGARALAGPAARRGRAARDVPAALGRRGQAQPDAAALRRPPAARRHAQPGHERHRQPRAEPAADAEPAAHVDADARRRPDHDDHDLVAARRWSRSSRSRCRSSRCKSITKRSKTQVRRPVAPHRHAERAGRGGVHRPLARQGVRAPARTSRRSSTTRTRSCSSPATPRSSSPGRSSPR